MKKIIYVILVCLFAVVMSACQSESVNYQLITSSIGDLTMEIEESYQLKEDEVLDQFHMTTYENEQGKQIRLVSEEKASYTVDEAVLEDELSQVDEIHVERTEIVEIENFGKVYGALLEDSQLAGMMFYYKFNVKESVYTLLFINGSPFTKEEEAMVKTMISTLKVKE